MTTNDKEYMKQYQRERRAKIKAAKTVKKDVKIVKKSVKNLENLRPPIEVGENSLPNGSGVGLTHDQGIDRPGLQRGARRLTIPQPLHFGRCG